MQAWMRAREYEVEHIFSYSQHLKVGHVVLSLKFWEDDHVNLHEVSENTTLPSVR